MEKQIYVVVSQTGTILSRLLKCITQAEYNHASVSLTPDLQYMYSFGRRRPYNPFWGGFVEESPYFGTFKRFPDSKIVVMAVTVNRVEYERLQSILNDMMAQQNRYHYNYMGLWLAAFRICRRKQNCFYCSEFVKEMLQQCRVKGSEELRPIVQPIHFLDLPYPRIYQGTLADYVAAVKQKTKQ